MKKTTYLLLLIFLSHITVNAQYIPLDTANWQIQAQGYLLENYKGKDAIYLQAGSMALKNRDFKNGVIEFKMFLKEEQCFPGIYYRYQLATNDSEQWFVRPHLSGKADANQAAPLARGITPWQLFFGERYSFAYEYNYEDWTHVKLIVNEDKAQVFLDGAEKPNLSWNLYHEAKAGLLVFRGGNASGIHIADVKVSDEPEDFVDFSPNERAPIEGAISSWTISDKFKEAELDNISGMNSLIKNRKWEDQLTLDEGVAANISKVRNLRDGTGANTVFAKVVIHADKAQTKRLEFGYSDRVVAILNGKPIYRGSNKWRSRDYRYLGTLGLFDEVYLNLKKGKNELLMAVSEDFGGWLVTGRIKDMKGIRIE